MLQASSTGRKPIRESLKIVILGTLVIVNRHWNSNWLNNREQSLSSFFSLENVVFLRLLIKDEKLHFQIIIELESET
jgi:hypothetical protein